MKTAPSIMLATVVVSVVAGSVGSALAQEKKIAVKDLPAAVSSAFKAAYPNAVIKEAGTEVEGGVEYCEIESVDGATKRDLLYTKNGKVYEIEEVVAAEALPDALKQAVAKAYPKGTIAKAEKTTRGTNVGYELKIKSEMKKYRMILDEQGKVVSTKEVKAKKKAGKKAEKKEKN